MITFEQLHQQLVEDPFYGRDAVAAEAIVREIYSHGDEESLDAQFAEKLARVVQQLDRQSEMIVLWCVSLGLPAYRASLAVSWQDDGALEAPPQELSIDLAELKLFLRECEWPPPVALYPDEPDNSRNWVDQEECGFEQAFHEFAEDMPKLESELAELHGFRPETMADRREKLAEVERLERSIQVIKTGEAPDDQLADSGEATVAKAGDRPAEPSGVVTENQFAEDLSLITQAKATRQAQQ